MLNSLTRTFSILALAVFVTVAGCDTVDVDDDPPGPTPDFSEVFVANQGNFGDGNASITTYNPETEETEPSAVGPEQLNSIVQSIALLEGDLFVASNTANRVDVFEPNTLERSAQVSDIDQPRYFAQVDDDRAYVTNMSDSVTAINLTTNEISERFEVGGNPEGVALAGSRVAVATGAFAASQNVVLIDPATNAVTDTVETGCDSPRHVFTHSQSEVVAVCTGRIEYDDDFQPIGEIDGAVRVIDVDNAVITGELDFDFRVASVAPGQDADYHPDEAALFVSTSDNEIVEVDVDMLSISSTIGPLAEGTIGAVAYEPLDDRLYVGLADEQEPFSASGWVQILERDGTEVSTFDAGIAPSHIVFRPVAQ